MKPYFKNPEGFKMVEDSHQKAWWQTQYHFTLDLEKPLTLVTDDGEWQPNRKFDTDDASIPRFPPVVRFLIPTNRFLAAKLHDSGYIEGGLWLNGAFRVMTRKQIDDLFKVGMEADPAPAWSATIFTVWSHVRMYGWAAWNNARRKQRSKLNPHGTDGILKTA